MTTELKKDALKAQFKKLDKNGDGSLDKDELKELLGKGGKGMRNDEIAKLFKAVDKSGDGVVQFDEFVDYIYSITPQGNADRTSAGRRAKHAAANASNDEGDASMWGDVEKVFMACCGKDGCDNREFAKLCKDCSLYNRKFKQTEADLVFQHVCKKERKMNFEMFQAACKEIAKRKGCATADVQEELIEAGGPKFAGTKADAVRFHDDKSTYTGAHATGGKHGEAGGAERGTDARHERLAQKAEADDLGDEALWEDMKDVFVGFCGDSCDGKEFAKLCKECGLYDKKFNATGADLIFAHVKEKNKRVIGYEQFKEAIGQIAEKKECSTADLQRMIKETGGPKFVGTKADAVRFHDDKSTYTGAHTHNEKHGASGGTDRDSADRQARLAAESTAVSYGDESLYGKVDEVFAAFCGKDCDGKEFVKMLKDCGIIKQKDVTNADLCFAHVCKKERRMNEEHFRQALGEMAKKLGSSTVELQEKVIATGGPTFQGTEADYVKFHDDKSTYTGQHYGK